MLCFESRYLYLHLNQFRERTERLNDPNVEYVDLEEYKYVSMICYFDTFDSV